MKYSSTLLPVVFTMLFSTVTFSAEQPQTVDAGTAAPFDKVGSVSISCLSGSLDDVLSALQQKAAQLGASKMRIVALGNPGDSDLWYGNADVFR